uniref:Uncharacterized protein n=1 Tax=Anopheles coluzzii TaxID=1518534 RepID=A0A8W7PKN4_ANOCL
MENEHLANLVEDATGQQMFLSFYTKNGSQQAMNPPTTMLSVWAVFVSRFSDEMRIGMRFPCSRTLVALVVTFEAHDSDKEIWLALNCTVLIGRSSNVAPENLDMPLALLPLRVVLWVPRDATFGVVRFELRNSYSVWCDVLLLLLPFG